MRRRHVPCSPCDGGSGCGSGCCGLKEKLAILWDRTIGSILKINNISPDGDGNFEIEAGSNIALSQTGTGNGIRIDTTGGVSYYTAGDGYVDVDNNDLEISLVNPGASGGVALHDDLTLVADAVSDILDGTTTVPKATDATNATYLGSNSANVGTDTKPVKIVNGQATAVTDDLQKKLVILTDNKSTNLVTSTPTFDLGEVTATKSGYAILSIRGGFQNSSTGYRLVGYSRNSTSAQEKWLTNISVTNNDYCYYSCATIISVTQGDVIRGCFYQTSGSTLQVSSEMGLVIL